MISKKTAAELKSYRPSRDSHKLAGFHPSVDVLAAHECPIELTGMEREVYEQQKYLVACFPSPSGISALLQLPELLAEHARARAAVRNTDSLDQTLYMRAIGSSAKLFDRVAKLCDQIAKETKLERMRTSITRSEDGGQVTMEQMIDLMKGN